MASALCSKADVAGMIFGIPTIDVWFSRQSGRREPTPLMSGFDPTRTLRFDLLPGDWCRHCRLLYWRREVKFRLYLALSEIEFDAKGVMLDVLHRVMEKRRIQASK